MITERDLVHLSYTRDLTEAGLVYARSVLLNQHEAASSRLNSSIRRTVASTALGLCFRRYLSESGTSFGVERPAVFTDPDRYDLRLGGRTCELKAYLISRVSQWNALSNDPRLALDVPALVPLDRHTAETVRSRDMYVFGLVGGQVVSPADSVETPSSLKDQFWIHVLPRVWRAPLDQTGLGPVILKAESDLAEPIELGGKDRSGLAASFSIRLSEGQRIEVSDSLLSLSYACTSCRPNGRVGFHSAARGLTHVIEPGDWQNVWLEGWGILLLGWLTREEFRSRAKPIPSGRRVFQFDRTRTRNLAVPVSELKPITDLIARSGLHR